MPAASLPLAAALLMCVPLQGPVPEGLGELGLRVALSVGELDKEAYQALYDAGEAVVPFWTSLLMQQCVLLCVLARRGESTVLQGFLS